MCYWKHCADWHPSLFMCLLSTIVTKTDSNWFNIYIGTLFTIYYSIQLIFIQKYKLKIKIITQLWSTVNKQTIQLESNQDNIYIWNLRCSFPFRPNEPSTTGYRICCCVSTVVLVDAPVLCFRSTYGHHRWRCWS